MMFGRKKLMARIAELEREVLLQQGLIATLRAEKHALIADIDAILHSNCDHEYQMVCSVVFHNVALVETGGLFSSGPGQQEIAKTYYHPYDDPNSDSNLVALYAYKCRNCHHLKPVTCFDVSSMSDCEWVESEGPLPYEGLKYMVCTGITKSKKTNNKLDSIVEECEKDDTTPKL